MTTEEALKIVVYSLTALSRPKKMRDAWNRKGFSKFTPEQLVDYWKKRLEKGVSEDIQLYEKVLSYYGLKLQPALPSVGAMFQNVLGAVVDVVVEGIALRPKEEIEAARQLCKKCPMWRESDNRCAACGCYLDYKRRLKAWHCPQGKW